MAVASWFCRAKVVWLSCPLNNVTCVKEREGREVDRGTSHPPPPAVEITDIKARLEAIEDAVKELRCEVSKPTVPKTVEDTNKIPTPTTNPPTAPEAPSVRVA